MRLFFLEAWCPLTKRFDMDDQGRLVKEPYPMVKKFTSHEVPVADMRGFYEALQTQATMNRCLLKGQLHKQLVDESRAGSTNPLDETEWMVIDIDGLTNFASPEDFIAQVLPAPFADSSYIVQQSASAGFSGQGIRSHLFFRLATPVLPELLKNWITRLNLDHAQVRPQLGLSANAMTLTFPLDRTVNQNDKLIYIAPPICGEGVEDPLAGQRIRLIEKTHDAVDFDFESGTGSYAMLQNDIDECVADLRDRAGLPKRKAKYKVIGGHNVLTNPGHAYVSGEKIGRGFIYLNLNGGDSWGYWYKPENPRFLHNFKGEPTVILRDLLPEYFEQIQGRLHQHQRQSVLYFRQHKTDTYFNGLYDPVNDRLVELAMVGTKDKIKDYCNNHGVEFDDQVDDWEFEFRPDQETIVDVDHKFVNKWQPTDLWRTAEAATTIPPLVERVLRSVVGGDQECFDHLLNWLACLVQFRKKLKTAWVLQGVQGTGKGLLVDEIMAPIIGREYCATKLLRDMDDRFNGWLETCLLLNVDEARISDSASASKTENEIKALITTESNFPYRAMRQNPFMGRNYTNLIFTSNVYDAMVIDPSDRRFNVAPRQESRLYMTEEDIAQLRAEVPQFAGFLKQYEANLDLAATALSNEAKTDLRHASQDSIEQFATAVMEGDLDFFMQAMTGPSGDILAYSEYAKIVGEWLEDYKAGRTTLIKAKELLPVYSYLLAPRSPIGIHKFIRMMAHKNLLLTKPVRHDNKTQRGFRVDWRATEDDVESWEQRDDTTPNHLREAS
jgi:hypothetical protein